MLWSALVGSTAWLTLTRMLGTLVSLVVTIVITRTMGVEELGYVIQIVSLVSLFYLPLDFGINPIALRSATTTSVWKLQQTAMQFRWRLAGVLLVILIGMLLIFGQASIHYQHPVVVSGVLILSVTIIIQAINKTSQIYWHQAQNFWIQGFYEVINASVSLAFVVIVIWKQQIIWLIVGYVVAQLLAMLVSVGLQPRSWMVIDAPQLPLRTFREAIPLAVAQIASTITSKLDIWMISLWLGPIATGVYGIPKRIIEVMLLLPFFAGSVLFASFVKQLPPKLTTIQVLVIAGGLGVVCAILLDLSAPLLTLISPELIDSISLLRWFGMLLPLYFVTAPLMWLLTAWGEQRWLLVVYVVGLIITFLSLLVLLPSLGLIGSVIAGGLGEVVILALLLYKVGLKYRHV